jgi:hypothetical protein
MPTREELIQKAQAKYQREQLVAQAKAKWEMDQAEREPAEVPEKGVLDEVVDTVDSYTGAPSRAAIGALENGKNPLTAFAAQFGEDPSKAPTGYDLVKPLGLSKSKIPHEILPLPFKALKAMGVIDPSWEDAGATVAETYTDWTNLLPGAGAAKKAFSATDAGKLAAKATDKLTPGLVKNLAEDVSLENLGNVANKAADKMGSIANEKTVKVLNQGADFTKLEKDGKVQELGALLRKMKTVGLFSTPGGIEKKLGQELDEIGPEISAILKKNSDAPAINLAALAEDLRAGKDVQGMKGISGSEAVLERANKTLDTLASNGEVDLDRAIEIRRGIDDNIKYERRGVMPQFEQHLSDQRNALNDQIFNSIETKAKDLGQTSDVARLKDLNKRYHLLAKGKGMAERQAAKNATNRELSLTDNIYGAAAVASGDITSAPLMAVGNKAIRTFGNSAMAKGAGAIEDALRKIPKFAEMAEKNPQAFNLTVQHFRAYMGDEGRTMLKAADAGEEERNPAKEPAKPIQDAQEDFIRGNQ